MFESLDFISNYFLKTLLDVTGTESGTHALRITQPEGCEDFVFTTGDSGTILTYSPRHRQVVMHFGLKTIQIHLQDWKEMQRQGDGTLFYAKEDVAYSVIVRSTVLKLPRVVKMGEQNGVKPQV